MKTSKTKTILSKISWIEILLWIEKKPLKMEKKILSSNKF